MIFSSLFFRFSCSFFFSELLGEKGIAKVNDGGRSVGNLKGRGGIEIDGWRFQLLQKRSRNLTEGERGVVKVLVVVRSVLLFLQRSGGGGCVII